MNDSTLAALVESSNADIRLMLGQLQMIRLRKRSLSYDDAKVLRAQMSVYLPDTFSMSRNTRHQLLGNLRDFGVHNYLDAAYVGIVQSVKEWLEDVI